MLTSGHRHIDNAFRCTLKEIELLITDKINDAELYCHKTGEDLKQNITARLLDIVMRNESRHSGGSTSPINVYQALLRDQCMEKLKSIKYDY